MLPSISGLLAFSSVLCNTLRITIMTAILITATSSTSNNTMSNITVTLSQSTSNDTASPALSSTMINTTSLTTPNSTLPSTTVQSLSSSSIVVNTTTSSSLSRTVVNITASIIPSSTMARTSPTTPSSTVARTLPTTGTPSSTVASTLPTTGSPSSTVASTLPTTGSPSSTVASTLPTTGSPSSTVASTLPTTGSPSSTVASTLPTTGSPSSTVASTLPTTGSPSSTVASTLPTTGTPSSTVASTLPTTGSPSRTVASTLPTTGTPTAPSTQGSTLASTTASTTLSSTMASTSRPSSPSVIVINTTAPTLSGTSASTTSSTILSSTSPTTPSSINSTLYSSTRLSLSSTLPSTLASFSLGSLVTGTTAPSTQRSTFNYTGTYQRYERESFPCETLKCIIVERYRYETHDILVRLTILLTIIGFVGTVGNVIVITVFIRNRVKRNSTYFMLTLAIIDLMVCSTVIPGVIAREWRTSFYSDVLCMGLEFMRSLMIPSSALVLVAIALDRFFLICMSTREIMTTFVTKIIIGMIMLIGMALGIPPLLSVGILEDMGSDLQICVKSDEYLDDTAQYQYWYFVTVLFGAMILAIMILYLLIFKKVIQQSQRWKNRPNKIFPERRNTGVHLHVKQISEPSTSKGQFDPIAPKQTQVTMVTELESVSSDKSVVLPSTSTNVGASNARVLKSRQSTHGMSINSNVNIKTMSDMKKRSTHVKTTQVLFIVTIIYIISFLPTFLETNEVVENNKYLTYIYFVNNAANPIIYSFMNAKFREELKMLYCNCCKK